MPATDLQTAALLASIREQRTFRDCEIDSNDFDGVDVFLDSHVDGYPAYLRIIPLDGEYDAGLEIILATEKWVVLSKVTVQGVSIAAAVAMAATMIDER